MKKTMAKFKGKNDPDVELVRQIAQGDEQAFEKIVRKYQQAIFNTIYRYIGSWDDVEDLAQEIFLKVWHNIKKFKGKAKFSTWLYRIAVNHCYTYRSKHKQPIISLDVLSEKSKIPASLQIKPDQEQKQRIELMKRAIDRLPERQRMALILALYEQKSYKQTADIMGISESAVESLIFRARKSLRRKFRDL